MSNVESWKSFIRGRIAIEQGDISGGIAAIDEAIRQNPGEPVFTHNRSIAESLLHRSSDGAVAELAADYARMAKANSGVNDKPDVWVKDLQGLLQKADKLASTTGIVW